MTPQEDGDELGDPPDSYATWLDWVVADTSNDDAYPVAVEQLRKLRASRDAWKALADAAYGTFRFEDNNMSEREAAEWVAKFDALSQEETP